MFETAQAWTSSYDTEQEMIYKCRNRQKVYRSGARSHREIVAGSVVSCLNSRLLTLCSFSRMCCVSFYVFHVTCSILHPKFLTDLPLNPLYLHSVCNSCRVSIHCTSHGWRRSWLLASRADLAMTLKPMVALLLPQCLFLQSWRAHLHHTEVLRSDLQMPPPHALVH